MRTTVSSIGASRWTRLLPVWRTRRSTRARTGTATRSTAGSAGCSAPGGRARRPQRSLQLGSCRCSSRRRSPQRSDCAAAGQAGKDCSSHSTSGSSVRPRMTWRSHSPRRCCSGRWRHWLAAGARSPGSALRFFRWPKNRCSWCPSRSSRGRSVSIVCAVLRSTPQRRSRRFCGGRIHASTWVRGSRAAIAHLAFRWPDGGAPFLAPTCATSMPAASRSRFSSR